MTANLSTPDPDIAPEPVEEPHEQGVERLISNCAGFGGTNASIILER